MFAFRSSSPTPDPQSPEALGPDPPLSATPEYGTLGPGSDIARADAKGTASSAASVSTPISKRYGPLFAATIGIFFAVLAGSIGSAHAAWGRFAGLLAPHGAVDSRTPTRRDTRQLDRLQPQTQAETLLEQAVGHSDGAVDQIAVRVDRWQGKLQWNPQIATLTTAALNSSDMRVRESGIEVELAAYGLAKNAASLDYVLSAAASSDHAQKIWALWALGLMANRGVAPHRGVQVLIAHLKDSDEDERHWAVEGLALAGTSETIEPLLLTMHNDPSAAVRESAACSLGESGMYTREQRLTAVPQLLAYTDDPALDAGTQGWAFRALADITGQHLPNDSAAWHDWYASNRIE